MQLKSLWDFMQVDIEADQFEAQMRKSPNRQSLIKHRNFLLEQQGNMKKLEGEIAVMQDRLEAVRDEAERLGGVLSSMIDEIDSNPPEDPEDAARKMDAMQKLTGSLVRYEQELQKMRRDAESRDYQQKEIRVRAAKAKQEYDQIRGVYDREYKSDNKKLANMRADIERESRNIDPSLLARYKAIKQHSTPPMARLSDDGQCLGCFMQLPSATLRIIKEDEKLVECDNCGRIIYCGD
ncbi:MAG: zinc ribbon domain-containing protein [Christensenellales bacterium]